MPVLDLLCSRLAVGLRARPVTSLTLRLLISPVSIMGEGSLGCFDNFEIPFAWCLAEWGSGNVNFLPMKRGRAG